MSQTGELVFFTETEPSAPARKLGELIAILGGRRLFHLGRTIGPDRSWEDFVRESEDLDHIPFTREEKLEPQTPVERIPDCYLPPTCLRVDFAGFAVAASKLSHAVDVGIPESIRGNHIPCELIIRFGPHDVFEWFYNEEGQLIARAFVSVSMYGQFTPKNWPGYREALVRLPAFHDLQSSIERVCGPVRHTYVWSV